MRLLPEFSHSVDLTKVPADDVLLIGRELIRIGDSLESIPTNSSVWDSFRHTPMTFRVKNWSVRYVVDERQQRLIVVDVLRA